MTYILHIEDDVREAALAQIRKMEGVRVVDADEDETSSATEEPYTEQKLVAELREAFAVAKEIKAGRTEGRALYRSC